MRLSTLTATVLAALALATVARAEETVRCGDAGYSYAGIGGLVTANGVRATLRFSSAPTVASGHVAAWVGFGGYGAGRNGSNAWLQVGVITKAGSAPSLYYEMTQPGAEPAMTLLGPAVPGRAYRLRVSESRPGWWQAFVDGKAVSPRLFLAGSHGNWEATATAESWDGAQPACNRFGFDFARVNVRHTQAWLPFGGRVTLQSSGYRVSAARPDSFRAQG